MVQWPERRIHWRSCAFENGPLTTHLKHNTQSHVSPHSHIQHFRHWHRLLYIPAGLAQRRQRPGHLRSHTAPSTNSPALFCSVLMRRIKTPLRHSFVILMVGAEIDHTSSGTLSLINWRPCGESSRNDSASNLAADSGRLSKSNRIKTKTTRCFINIDCVVGLTFGMINGRRVVLWEYAFMNERA